MTHDRRPCVGGRSWHISPRPRAEGEALFAGATVFCGELTERNQREGMARHHGSSLRNKRPDLSGRPPCKGVAVGVYLYEKARFESHEGYISTKLETVRGPRGGRHALDPAKPTARRKGWGSFRPCGENSAATPHERAKKKKRRPQFPILAHLSPPAQEQEPKSTTHTRRRPAISPHHGPRPRRTHCLPRGGARSVLATQHSAATPHEAELAAHAQHRR